MPKRELLLLALDDASILQLMSSALRAAHFDTAIVSDAAGLEKALGESSPALLMIGEKFGGQDGLALGAKSLERFPTLPVLLYANKESSGLAKRVLEAGLSGYLVPPLKTDDILQAVQRCMARALRVGDWLRREVRRTTSSLKQRVKFSETERARFETVFSSIQDGVVALDEENHILYINPAAYQMFQVKTEETTGRDIMEVIPHPDLRALLSRALREPVKYHEINLDTGQVLNAQFTPIPSLGSVVTMQDISYLKELDHMKSDFVHTVSHDLRSPLTALLGYAELIDRVGPLTEQQRDFLQRIQGSVQHITTLVNDLLDLGRLEGGFDTRRETVHMGNILKYTLDTFENEARAKEIEITCWQAEEIPPLRANPIRIRQLLDNLVGNAIKYTSNGGKVHVEVGATDDQIILEVRDTGPGIPQKEQSHIFDKFYRASNVPDGSAGTGLGLAIVKSIVESYQGRIWVESAVGHGSSFFVVLPSIE